MARSIPESVRRTLPIPRPPTPVGLAGMRHDFNMITNPALLAEDPHFHNFVSVHKKFWHEYLNIVQVAMDSPPFPCLASENTVPFTFNQVRIDISDMYDMTNT